MKKILVVLNPAANSERIANVALKIAGQINANLLICNPIETRVKSAVSFSGQYDSQWASEDTEFINTEELLWKLRQRSKGETLVDCLPSSSFNPDQLKKLVIDQSISMIVMGTDDLLDLNTTGTLQMINKANCPVLLIPKNGGVNSIESTCYLTDLRYCDIDVVRFLKNLNAKIFITHLSLSDLPDMEDGYAQSMSDTIAAQINYNKLFLRNIKSANDKTDLETVAATTNINFYTIVNQKHNLLDRFLSDNKATRRTYHNLPLLIMPYLSWHRV